MAGIQSRRFNWNPRQSAWQEMQSRRERSKAFREDYAASSQDTNSRLAAAWSGNVGESGNLAAKAALARIQAAAAAKLKESSAADSSFSVWKNKEPATEVSVGDTKVDFNSNTLTLSDGTQIDIKTGVKKVNLIT